MTSPFEQARDAFHAHLDACERCAKQPFNLCTIGATLLKEAATVDEDVQDFRTATYPRTARAAKDAMSRLVKRQPPTSD